MDKNITALKFFSQVFVIYGVVTVLLNFFCVWFGTSAYGVSTIFSLGKSGVSVVTSFQFLLAIVVMSGLRCIFMTDILIKNMSLTARIILMFAGAFTTILVFSFVFGWFPVDDPAAWFMFIICFVISCGVSTVVSALAEKQENRRLEEALKRYKEEP